MLKKMKKHPKLPILVFWGSGWGKIVPKPQTLGLDGGNLSPNPKFEAVFGVWMVEFCPQTPNPGSGWWNSAPKPQILGCFWGLADVILNPDNPSSHAGVPRLAVALLLQAQLPVGPCCPALGQPAGVDADAAQHLLWGDSTDWGSVGAAGPPGVDLGVKARAAGY